MSDLKKINSALISVFSKEGLDPIVKALNEQGVTIYSTGGTQSHIEKLGVKVEAVEDLTSYPSILGGRVKTLHPKVFGGILSRRSMDEDQAQLSEYAIPSIDLVIVDLYPFEKTVAETADEAAIIEKIDIGGISLIRAAAKNFNDVVVIPSKDEYDDLLHILQEKQGFTATEDRKKLAAKAFNVTSHYDVAIFNYFNTDVQLPVLKVSRPTGNQLRYGENPHQNGWYYGDLEAQFEQLHGKALSYNNLLDIDAAIHVMADFVNNDPTFAILKHNNTCGLATRKELLQAWQDALAGDPVSAFGGILITNRQLDEATAAAVNELFFEVIIAPGYDAAALTILQQKKNRIILLQQNKDLANTLIRSACNGFLVQERDAMVENASNFTVATNREPTQQETEALVFANKIVKHTKSNTIVLAKNDQLLASGTGQTSRVDALKQAIEKAKSFNFDLKGAVMASDAFFPFADCVEIAHNAGITAVVQPGGSIRDQESVDYCNEHEMAMVMTGTRHFKH